MVYSPRLPPWNIPRNMLLPLLLKLFLRPLLHHAVHAAAAAVAVACLRSDARMWDQGARSAPRLREAGFVRTKKGFKLTDHPPAAATLLLLPAVPGLLSRETTES